MGSGRERDSESWERIRPALIGRSEPAGVSQELWGGAPPVGRPHVGGSNRSLISLDNKHSY